MSLDQLRKPQLIELANKFDLDVAEDDTKSDIINLLKENNITFATWKKFVEESEEVEPAISFEEKNVLLKMDRQNASFEAFGVSFTKEHPFAIVSEHAAQEIIDNFDGFRVASPAEAKQYYS